MPKSLYKHVCDSSWYISKELIGLAFLDDNFLENQKIAIVYSLAGVKKYRPLKRHSPLPNNIILNKLSSNTIEFFKIFKTNEFLKLPTLKCNENTKFQGEKSIIDSFDVTNNFAERGVVLM